MPSPRYNEIENRVSVTHNGQVWMYCYRDGDEAEIVQVIKKDVSLGKLHPFAGGMLTFLIKVGDKEETD